MFSGIPLFPEQASTLAADVDALYLFIVAVTAFFGILTTVVVIYFAAKYRTDDPVEGWRAHPRFHPPRAGLVDHPVPHHHRDLRLGLAACSSTL